MPTLIHTLATRKPKFGTGRYPKVHFKVTYATIAHAKGVSLHAVKKAVQEDRLDPSNLRSIAEYILAAVGRPENFNFLDTCPPVRD